MRIDGRHFFLLIWLMLAAALPRQSAAADPKALSTKTVVSFELVDSNGKPVEGANLCLLAHAGKIAKILATEANTRTEWFYDNRVRSDAQGRATMICDTNLLTKLGVVARQEGRKIMAIASVDPKSGKTVKMQLVPEREIRINVTSKALAEQKKMLGDVRLSVFSNDKRSLIFDCPANDVRLTLPPGKYEVDTNSEWPIHTVRTSLTVAPEPQSQRAPAIDLPVQRLFSLEGKPAPELTDVLAWKNTEPIRLADLRGRCVLLEFGGYWCGPCIQQMPKLFELHDKYQKQGLTIIWVQRDYGEAEETPVDTVAELDSRLKSARERLWNGRDIPFPVAIVSGKPKAIAGGLPGVANSSAFAEYGIRLVPEAVLINRQGQVVKRFDVDKEESIQLLEKTLAEK